MALALREAGKAMRGCPHGLAPRFDPTQVTSKKRATTLRLRGPDG
jgi:hypothetical protein